MLRRHLIQDFTRGGQTTVHSVRMLVQVARYLVLTSLLFLVVFNAGWFYFKTNTFEKALLANWGLANLYVAMGQSEKPVSLTTSRKQIIQQTAFVVTTNPTIAKGTRSIQQRVHTGFQKSLFICGGLVLVAITWLSFAGFRKRQHQFRRGVKATDSHDLSWRLKIKNKASDFKLAQVPLLKDSETKHILVSGSSGTGKTVAICELLDQIRTKKQRAIVYDRIGTFVKHYYRKDKDILLNPLDERSPQWHVWAEGCRSEQLDTLASALIPPPSPYADKTWVESARTLFAVVAGKLHQQGQLDLPKLLGLLLSSDIEKLAEFVKGTAAEPLVTDKAVKFALSVIGTLAPAIKPLQFLTHSNHKPLFSIRNWIANDNEGGWLFISSRADQQATLRPLISAWLEIATNSLLSLPPSTDRRIWTILDELPSLHKLPSLPVALAESRQFGGCTLLSIQTIAQLREIYGRDGAESLSGLCNTRLSFRTPDPVTAEWVSDSLGKAEIDETKEGVSYGAHQIRDGVSLSSQTLLRPVVLPSEILALDDLTGYLKLPGSWPIAKVKLKPKKRNVLGENFVSSSSSTQSIQPITAPEITPPKEKKEDPLSVAGIMAYTEAN